jgi:exosortase
MTMTRRNLCFTLLVLSSLVAFSASLKTLAAAAIEEPEYSHLLLILPVSVSLIYRERRTILANANSSFALGASLVVASLIVTWAGRAYSTSLSRNDHLSLTMLSLVVFWVAAFVLCYGLRSFRAGRFPMLFLFLLIPIPDFLLGKLVLLLQQGSVEAARLLFSLAGVPFAQKGLVLVLPGVEIEVAKECSGIRSGLILLIAGLVLGRLFLHSFWGKVALSLSVFPITVAKNGLRIFTLSILGTYVDPAFLRGSLHRYGGTPFFLLALLVLQAFLKALQRFEASPPTIASLSPSSVPTPRPAP